jgi:hypothetical protein
MHIQPRLAILRFHPIVAAVLLCLVSFARAEAETISATAHVKGSGGTEVTSPVTIVLDRPSTDAERDELLAVLKKSGTTGVRDLLALKKAIGTVRVGSTNTAIKYAYSRTTGSGRLVTALTDLPIAFVGAGLPGAKPKTGFDLGLVLLDLAGPGSGSGEIAPAAKIRVDAQGAIVTEDYGAEAVRLSNISGK